MGNPGAAWRKWRLLACFWLVQTTLLAFAPALWVAHVSKVDGKAGRPWGGLDVEEVLHAFRDPEYWIFVGVVAAGMIALQAIMLLPVRRPRARSERGWPLWLSAAAGGVGATGLSAGAVLLGVALIRVLELEVVFQGWDDALPINPGWFVLGAILVSWIAGTACILSFMRRRLGAGDRHEGAVGRVAKLLLKGTAIEALAVIPLDVMIRRKTDCYSTEGTAWTITLCFSVGLLALGPAIVVPLIARRRKDFYAGRCELCLYDMRELIASGRPIDRCPECGGGWKPAGDTRAASASEPPAPGAA